MKPLENKQLQSACGKKAVFRLLSIWFDPFVYHFLFPHSVQQLKSLFSQNECFVLFIPLNEWLATQSYQNTPAGLVWWKNLVEWGAHKWPTTHLLTVFLASHDRDILDERILNLILLYGWSLLYALPLYLSKAFSSGSGQSTCVWLEPYLRSDLTIVFVLGVVNLILLLLVLDFVLVWQMFCSLNTCVSTFHSDLSYISRATDSALRWLFTAQKMESAFSYYFIVYVLTLFYYVYVRMFDLYSKGQRSALVWACVFWLSGKCPRSPLLSLCWTSCNTQFDIWSVYSA